MARSLLFLVGVVACAQNALAVWPLPTTYQTGTEAVKLSSGFSISYAKGLKPPSDLALAVSRTESFIKTDKLERLVVGRSSADASKLGKAKSLTKLTLHLTSTGPVKSIAQEAVYALDAREESYTLSVPAGGEATITANSTMGLFRGLTTFQQLWYTSGNTIYSVEAPISITDKPVYVGLDNILLFSFIITDVLPRHFLSLTVDSCWTPRVTTTLWLTSRCALLRRQLIN